MLSQSANDKPTHEDTARVMLVQSVEQRDGRKCWSMTRSVRDNDDAYVQVSTESQRVCVSDRHKPLLLNNSTAIPHLKLLKAR